MELENFERTCDLRKEIDELRALRGSIRADIAKHCLCSIIRFEGPGDDGYISTISKEEHVQDAVKYADLLLQELDRTFDKTD